MLVNMINNDYEFVSPTTDRAFIVTLTLTEDGKEKLHTVPVGVAVSFKQLDLKPGTIKKAIGKERWENFLKMKKQKISTMFIDPKIKGFIPQVW